MENKIILKPTDYDIGLSGENEDNYPFEKLKEDVKNLHRLSREELIAECGERWRQFAEFPVPSGYRKYRAAYDLARAKGYEVSMNGLYTSKAVAKNDGAQPGL